jgi:hypothetical protein
MTATANIQPLNDVPDEALIFELAGARVFMTPSDSTERIYTIIEHEGHYSCNCRARGTVSADHVNARPCKHLRRLLAAKAGF